MTFADAAPGVAVTVLVGFVVLALVRDRWPSKKDVDRMIRRARNVREQ